MLGSGALPLATQRDRRAFVAAAEGSGPAALANNVYSADIVAISGSALLRDLRDVPNLPADNALPRWLEEVAGVPVSELDRWRLGIDLDSPLDLLLLGRSASAARLRVAGIPLEAVEARLQGIRAILGNRRAELVLAGRTSARDAAGAGARHGLPGPGARRGARPAGIEHARVWDGRRWPGRSHRLP